MKYIKYGWIGLLVLFSGGCAKNASYEFAKNGDIDSMKTYLSEGGDPNLCITVFGTPLAKSQCNPLHDAVFYNHFKMVRLLVENGADASTRVRDPFGDPLLNVAIETANTSMITYLMDHGAETNDYYIPGTKYGKQSGTSCGYHERMCEARVFAIDYADELKMKRAKIDKNKMVEEKNTQLDSLLGL